MPSVDRLSSLPDDILCRILSFIPTNLSVATSILARRWRFLWTHVPNLDFDNEIYSGCSVYPDIIYSVMMLHKVQDINTFRLHYWDGDNDFGDVLQACITTAIARNVKNLDLRLHYHYTLYLSLFTCKTLVNLKLCCYLKFIESPTICLPCLKKLHLYHCVYDFAEEGLPRLLSYCPVIEELILDRRVEDYLVCCNVCSPTLKFLRVYFPSDFEYSYYEYKVEINAPALRYLQLNDSVSAQISAQMLTSLIEADICLDYYYTDLEEDEGYFVYALNFIDSLHNVKFLKLSSSKTFYVGLFAEQSKPIIRFDNLIKLELCADWLFLTKFLQTADNLEVLIIREVKDDIKNWMEPERVPVCLLSSLKDVRIDGFGCTQQEFDMVGYLLKHAKFLKGMEIFFRNHGIDAKAKFDGQHTISSFQRGSEACELAFY